MRVYGSTVDDATRCIHYSTVKDIVAIRFRCCDRYYPCFECHSEGESHPAEQWPVADFDRLAILCGNCHTELTISAYRAADECATCHAAFNERCRLHAHLYFDVSAETDTTPTEGITA